MNNWEEGVLEEEQEQSDYVCWLRNPPRKPWSLCIPYEMGGEQKPAYPDFLIIRKDTDGEYVIDILEPHDPTRIDNLGKVKGFAEYACQNPGVGRIELIRMGKDGAGHQRFKRLDMARSAIRDKVSRAMTNDELDHIFDTGQIAPVVETASYNWLDINTFRSYLTAYQINNPYGRDLYSLNSARIDFVPYQFRPALKLVHADEPRILIADSVGVGKTIEAGIILKELQARNELENVMIICPKPLVTERKWELEMKRFDEDFIPLKGEELRQIISDTDRDGEWPVRYGKTIVPFGIGLLGERRWEKVLRLLRQKWKS